MKEWGPLTLTFCDGKTSWQTLLEYILVEVARMVPILSDVR